MLPRAASCLDTAPNRLLTNVRMRTEDAALKYFVCSLATQAVRKMVAYYNRALEPLGLTAQQVMALGVLWREDGLSLGGFAQRAGMGKAAAVTMIQRLEAMGLVSKEADPADARLNVLRLTDRVREIAPDILAVGSAMEKRIEAAVGTEDMAILMRALGVIRDLDI